MLRIHLLPVLAVLVAAAVTQSCAQKQPSAVDQSTPSPTVTRASEQLRPSPPAPTSKPDDVCRSAYVRAREAIGSPDSLGVAIELEQAGQDYVACAQIAGNSEGGYTSYLTAASTLESAGQEYHAFSDTSRSSRALEEAEAAANHALHLAQKGYGSVADVSDKLSAIHDDMSTFGQ